MREVLILLSDVLFIVNILFAVVIVFSERKNPAVTWAWLMVALIVPYFGFVIYLVLGFDGRKHRVFLEKSVNDAAVYKSFLRLSQNAVSFLNTQMEVIKRQNILDVSGAEHFDDMVFLNFVSGNGAYTDQNELKIYNEGNAKFDDLLKDIKAAKHFIFLEYYIVRSDELASRVVAALAEKAKEGVAVKFLIDGMGCATTSKKVFRPLTDAGGEVGVFLPPYFVRLNFRNHRKLAIIDGTVGYIGGLNIGNEYLGQNKRFGFWRDCHIRVDGDAVKQMTLRFLMDWNYVAENYDETKLTPLSLSDGLFPEVLQKERPAGLQIVSSGPDTKYPSILYGYTKMIDEANRSVYIQSPYFVPEDSVLESIRVAALSGIDVRIMIPAHPDHPFVFWAAISYLGELMESGVKCYKYEKGFVHSKMLVVDSLVSSVGTANMDVRSFRLNFEVSAFIYSEATAKALEEKFLEDLKDCTELTPEWYHKRSRVTKIKESVSRLLSPIL